MSILRMVLRGGIRYTTSISKSNATTQNVVSTPLLLTPRRRIMNQTTTNQLLIFFGNHHHHHRRHCHHVTPVATADKPPHSPFEDEDEDEDDTSDYDSDSFSDCEAEQAEPIYVDDPEYEDYIINSAHFAINSHNQKQNAQLQFVRVLKADELHVGGSRLYITLEVNDAGKSDFYRTIIYYRPWEKKRRITAWEHVEEPPHTLPPPNKIIR